VTENREAFFTRLEPFFAPSTLLDVQLMYTLAKFGHRSQVRKELDEEGDPIRYFEHVRRVAIILIDEARIVKPEMIIAALGHDTVEDTRDVTPAMLERCFGTDVVSIIKVLSKTPKEGYIERFWTCTDWRPYVIKACDRLDNLRSLEKTSVGFRTRQIAETRDKYFPLFDRMIKLTPDEFIHRSQTIRDSIRQETQRQATLLEIEHGHGTDGAT